MILAQKTIAAINSNVEKDQKYHRWHLGASVIGKKCAREVWFSYRWALNVHFDGRMLRLFARGHDEEPRIIKWLNDAGIETYCGDKNGQLKISACHGHFGGSLDGIGRNIPDIPIDIAALLEFKTINEKGFTTLTKQGAIEAKWQHFVQQQIYMKGYGLHYSLYLVVNKNNDFIHGEVISRDDAVADKYLAKAEKIIFSDQAPPRMSDNPSWYECKFCDYIKLCHYYAVPVINCRTCAHSAPCPDKPEWSCQLGQPEINQKNKKGEVNKEQPGCAHHVMNPNLLNGAEILGGNSDGNFLTIQWRGKEFDIGPNHVTSEELCNIGLTK